MKRPVRSLCVCSTLALVAALAGSAAADPSHVHGQPVPSTEPAPTTPAPTTPAPGQAPEAGSMKPPIAPGARGMLRVLADALGEISLSPQQRAEIQTLFAQAQARQMPVRMAKRQLMSSLADQIEEGQIDREALEPALARIAAAKEKAEPQDRAAFERLHGILEPDQRDQLADALEQRLEAHVQEHKSNAWVDKAAEKLGLDEQQKQQMRAAVDQHRQKYQAQMQARHDKIVATLEAYRADCFNIDEIAPAEDASKAVHEMSGMMLDLVEGVLPILTPEQRADAARMLREKSAHKGWRVPRMERRPAPGAEPPSQERGEEY